MEIKVIVLMSKGLFEIIVDRTIVKSPEVIHHLSQGCVKARRPIDSQWIEQRGQALTVTRFCQPLSRLIVYARDVCALREPLYMIEQKENIYLLMLY